MPFEFQFLENDIPVNLNDIDKRICQIAQMKMSKDEYSLPFVYLTFMCRSYGIELSNGNNIHDKITWNTDLEQWLIKQKKISDTKLTLFREILSKYTFYITRFW